MTDSDDPIDVVISWVDGKECSYQEKITPYLGHFFSIHEDINAPTRFNSEGEIFFCVASILKFAPFVRQIFIVTDGQDPKLNGFVKINFPDNNIPIKVIDHKDIFKGYEELLPTFNSLSIETLLYRIPDLSENFVYFNDDFFLLRPVKPTDWFKNGKAVAYGHWRSIAYDKFISDMRPKKNGHKPFSFKDSMLNAAKILGKKQLYFRIRRTPQPLNKSILQNFFLYHSGTLVANITHKFRQKTQYNPQALFYLLAFESKACIKKSDCGLLLIKPAKKGISYVKRKIKVFENNKNILFGCIESVDMSENSVQDKLFDWLSTVLEVKM